MIRTVDLDGVALTELIYRQLPCLLMDEPLPEGEDSYVGVIALHHPKCPEKCCSVHVLTVEGKGASRKPVVWRVQIPGETHEFDEWRTARLALGRLASGGLHAMVSGLPEEWRESSKLTMRSPEEEWREWLTAEAKEAEENYAVYERLFEEHIAPLGQVFVVDAP